MIFVSMAVRKLCRCRARCPLGIVVEKMVITSRLCFKRSLISWPHDVLVLISQLIFHMLTRGGPRRGSLGGHTHWLGGGGHSDVGSISSIC